MSQPMFGTADAGQAARPQVDVADTAGDARAAVADFQDASSLPQVFVAGVSVKREVDDLLAHPMQGFWDNGLGFLVEWCMYPFRPLFEQVTGDPEQMRATGAGWQKMAEFVNGLAESDAREQEGLRQYWEGEAAEAHSRQKQEFQDGLRSLADSCLQLKEHLDQIADFFEGLWDILVDIVREFVEGLIITWLAALATAAISFGASVAAAWATSAARVSITLSRILTQISKALQWLVKALKHLKELKKAIEEAIKAQSLLVRTGLRVAGARTALRYLDPMSMAVRGATGLTGMKPGKTALDSGTELATDQALTEAGEEAVGENQREQRNQDNMDRGFQ
ncbi:WXG100 family type VII secretion target [Actinokineospora sp.]|uniref:WXG100 family type VII secretion target n=1 Tax=Actinokineospora sp. TaxID=1872133 RepID=UPI003D6C1782